MKINKKDINKGKLDFKKPQANLSDIFLEVIHYRVY